MPGFLVHRGASVLCTHGGQAQPTAANARVKVSGQPTVTVAAPYTVTGCALPPPPNGNGPCATGKFLSAAARLKSGGQPLLLVDSKGICAPSATPIEVKSTQQRATGK